MAKPLTDERKQEIALIILRKQFKRLQFALNKKEIDRKIGQTAAELKNEGVTKEEIASLTEEFIREAVEEAFESK